jgi:hypothetical protein
MNRVFKVQIYFLTKYDQSSDRGSLIQPQIVGICKMFHEKSYKQSFHGGAFILCFKPVIMITLMKKLMIKVLIELFNSTTDGRFSQNVWRKNLQI